MAQWLLSENWPMRIISEVSYKTGCSEYTDSSTCSTLTRLESPSALTPDLLRIKLRVPSRADLENAQLAASECARSSSGLVPNLADALPVAFV